jgi:two-component system repressor protein LuxO
MSKPRVLLTEDSASLAAIYQAYLHDEPIDLIHVSTGQQALAQLENSVPDIILLDLHLPDMDGMEILKQIYEQGINCAVIIITAHGSVDIAVDAMRYGAHDFLSKPFDAKRLKVTLSNTLKYLRLNQLLYQYQSEQHRESYYDFIGRSLPMQGVYRIVESAATSKATIFITGESGTGKEVCASAIHQASDRKNAPFIALNCAAIPKELMESEIFGHTKGAFTGAVSDRLGAAQMADGGTLFLDEVCEMDLELQSKLLRFIQTGTFQPVGANKSEKVDVRFVCATNRDPLKEVELGRFREDLYYRLHVIPIHLPPLRDRGEDIMLIGRYLLEQISKEEGRSFTGFDAGAEQCLLHYSWPGNVRQLENVLRNTVVLNDADLVTLSMLPPPLGKQPLKLKSDSEPSVKVKAQGEAESIVPLWILEKSAIEHAIDYCDGNVTKAANLLEVSPSTIYRKLQSWEGTA